jgi:hypothetical protein
VIPVRLVPILNQPALLVKMLDSIDYSVEQTIIIDNGAVIADRGGNGWGHSPLVPDIRIIWPHHNLGVGASWNLGLKVTPKAPYWLIVNHDVEFGPGDLQRMDEAVDPIAAGLYLFSNELGLAAFAITRHTLNAVGYFDENIHPAYNEDLDFARRCDLAGLPRYEIGWTGTHVGSATINSDFYASAGNAVTHGLNDKYYEAKWGGSKLGGETFTTPFNKGGHLGDWRLDSERLRSQAWPKR